MVIESYYHRGFVSSTGEQCSPLRFCCREFQPFFIRFSSFKQGAGSAFLCDQNLSSCSPNSRWQNVSSYTATLQDIRFGIIPLYLSRKWGDLLHKKCNNCRNVAKLKDKSFVCTSLVVRICAVVIQNYYRNIDENTRKKLCLCSYPTILIYINICDFNKKQLTNRGGLVYYYIVIV